MEDTQALQEEIRRLNEVIASMDKSAMMLVHRDLELRRANQRLSELDQNKSEFVTIAAHQMRTPLSAIRWSQQMLKNEELGPLNENQHQIIEQTLHSVNALITLVNNLLTADHLELGRGNDVTKRVNVATVITEVISQIFQLATEKGIRIEFPEADAVAYVEMNPDRLHDIFMNLIDNAIKYTPENGQISVRLTDGATISVSVTDTGVGIPEEYHGKIFSRFYRADNAQRVDPNGSGLGLYIVKRIVEANGGTISFMSTPAGTTFTVELQKARD